MRSQPIFNVPVGVTGALGAMAAVYAAINLLPEKLGFDLLWSLAFVPARYGGEAVVGEIPGGTVAAVTSFVTYMLVHGDLTHLIVNSVWMLAFGSAVAKRAGSLKFLAFSLCCGIAGILVHLVLYFGDLRPVVGASAAVSGQMAAALRFVMSRYSHPSYSTESIAAVPLASVGETLRNPKILAVTAIWTAVNLVFGLGYLSLGNGDAGIAWEAHIGGFLFGLLGFGLFDRVATPPPAAAGVA